MHGYANCVLRLALIPLSGPCEPREPLEILEQKMSGETSGQSPILRMPEGCRCGLEWYAPDDSEGYLWNYLTLCPVRPEDHTVVWRPAFQYMISSGSGGGIAPGGARLMINDGQVCDPLLHLGVFVLSLMCNHWW